MPGAPHPGQGHQDTLNESNSGFRQSRERSLFAKHRTRREIVVAGPDDFTDESDPVVLWILSDATASGFTSNADSYRNIRIDKRRIREQHAPDY
jgi:hypothetical protein